MTALPPRRALRQLIGSGQVPPIDPLVREGYSISRRVFAGLLGVHLLQRAQAVQAADEASPVSAYTDNIFSEGCQDGKAANGDATDTDGYLRAQKSTSSYTASPQMSADEDLTAQDEPVLASAMQFAGRTRWQDRRAFNRLVKETLPPPNDFTPDRVNADEFRKLVVSQARVKLDTTSDEADGPALDNMINARANQWISQINAQHARYHASTRYLYAKADARLRACRTILLIDELQLISAGEHLTTAEGRRAHKRAAKSYRKAFLRRAVAQARLRQAEASREYYESTLEAANLVRDEAERSMYALREELKQLARLELVKRSRDVSSSDVFLASPERAAERMPPGPDRPGEE